jgi:hypothetical protein
MWLSGANAVAGKACGAGVAEMRRQQTSVTKQAARFWSGTWLAPSPSQSRSAAAEPASSGDLRWLAAGQLFGGLRSKVGQRPECQSL